MHNKEILNRDELDEDEAKELLDRIRARLWIDVYLFDFKERGMLPRNLFQPKYGTRKELTPVGSKIDSFHC